MQRNGGDYAVCFIDIVSCGNLPAVAGALYYLAAQAETSLGHSKAAFDLRQQAYNLEQKKDSIQSLATNMQLAQAQPQQRDRRKEFSALAAQNQESNDQENKYDSETRGNVQKHHTDVLQQSPIPPRHFFS